ncbi:hypothetical protein E5Q_01618 [Mixia osmundae IAM 14324]|uniref:Enoyl reductase (ER) domain-containing protein n=2 Tax=Mixia osmundae (strain CBS 9802 / IAM 14324 / JCM 22182 / KY 12970) TaxID=764103 RepID=G7DWK3_MIXOS|nr:hypothetical protein E5Q_01618 [Mixia osmundae IAM 14324]
MGHEFVGSVHSVGEGVKSFKEGDRVVAPFTLSCGQCFQCERGLSSRCKDSKLFGSIALDGAQAEYVRVPHSESTLFHAPTDVPSSHLVIMADIMPTGFFASKNAWTMLNETERKGATAVVIGCGPVGLCAITAATQNFKTVFAIDSVPDRLDLAKQHGAIPIDLNAKSPSAVEIIQKRTDGRGPDAVLELVGAPDALQLAIDLVRVGGVIASCGLHTHDITLKGIQLYNKNIKFQFGRCPVSSLFEEALALLRKVSKENPKLWDNFIQAKVPLDAAPEYYEKFDKRLVGKTVFTM